MLGWFPASKFFGRPQKSAATKTLSEQIELRRQIVQAGTALAPATQQLAAVTKAAKTLSDEITELQRVAGAYASGPEITGLSNALDVFLRAAPGNAPGGQQKQQIVMAAKLAPLVAKCLEAPDRPPPSLVSEDGPVVKVLVGAIERIFGTAISPATLSHGLKDLRKRKPS